MKRSRLLIILIATFMFPGIVNASSVNVSCNSVTVGEGTRCVIQGSSPALQDIEAHISVSGPASITSITSGSGFNSQVNSGEGKSGEFAYITERDKTGSFTIATINLNTEGTGTVNVKVYGISATVSDNSINSEKSASFLVKEKTTQPTKPNTTKKNNITSPTNNTTEKTNITSPVLSPLKLLSVTVDNFPVVYQNGAYYVTTENFIESVTIAATAEEGVSIIGAGIRNLTYGKNVVELILKNTSGQSNTYQVIITRPDDTNIHDTKLTNLKVVNYGMAFDPNKKEYTIKIPYNIEEIYVIAETLNSDVNISGAGLKTLTKGENKIYIKVSYGELESTDYVITIKRSYSMMILLISSGLLGLGLVVALIYAYINRKAAMDAKVVNRNRVIAEGVRQEIQANNPNVSLNGQSVIGDGRRTVVPTKVVRVKNSSQQPSETPVKVVTNNGQPEPQIRLVRKVPIDQIPKTPDVNNSLERQNNNL